jgi:flagellin
MALTINTNVSSLNAQRNLGISQGSLSKSMQRLSSGLRINSAKDDAAGLAISDRMTAQVRGLNQAARNANDGISMAQTAEGALQEITNLMQRVRELAVQGGNDSNGVEDRLSIDAEITQLTEEVTRISTATEFNGTALLDGSLAATFQIGANSGGDQTITVTSATNFSAGSLGIDALTVVDNASAQAAIDAIDLALADVDTTRGELGAIQNRFESTIANLNNVSENISAARSRILDADIAQETSSMTKSNILQQAGVAILAQANQAPQLALSLLQ